MAEIGTDIEKAKELIEAGKLVAVPTDTVYGLAGDSSNETALSNIFKVKKRPSDVPLIALSDSIEKLQKMTMKLSSLELKVAEYFWPGALTLIVGKQSNVADIMTASLDTIGIRIPANPLSLQLMNLLEIPLAVTSANIHGEPSPLTAHEVNDQLGSKIKYILDGGKCAIGEESTIVSIPPEGIKIFREGAISKKEIEQVMNS